MKKIWIQKKVDASYTVEAALLFPIIVLVIITLIYVVFYFHDRICIKTMVHELGQEEIDWLAYGKDLESKDMRYDSIINQSLLYYAGDIKKEQIDALFNYTKKQLQKKLLITSISDINLKTSLNRIVIEAVIEFHIPVQKIVNYFDNKTLSVLVTVDESYFKREELVRVLTIAESTKSNIKGFDEMFTTIKNLVNKIR